MNWLEKVRFTIAEKKRVGYGSDPFIDISYRENRWTPEEISTLQHNHPNLPKEYMSLIQEFDSIDIAWIAFYGSNAYSASLLPKINYWREEGLPEEYFPFGKGPGGELYCFNKQNEVIEFASDDYEFENPVVVASSLEDFIDNDLLGKRFSKWNNIETSSFYQFLKAQGWV